MVRLKSAELEAIKNEINAQKIKPLMWRINFRDFYKLQRKWEKQ